MGEASPVRFGILGCASIARRVSRAIALAPNATISAIGSRSLEKATTFAKENGYPSSTKIYGSYEAVLDDPEVDAVYVPLPTSLHLKWAVLVAQKKKHLLLEKPVAFNVKELDTILEACESNGVQFMDGTMWIHHPRTAKMKDFLSHPDHFGQLKSVHSTYAFHGDENFFNNNIRVKPDLDGLGALGDAGWYGIQAILWTNDYEMPNSVTAFRDPELNEAGVILSCGASFTWRDGRIATFTCSFLTNIAMDIVVNGTQGALRVHDFVIPFQENIAPFYTLKNSRFVGELFLGVGPPPSEQNISTHLPQEAHMVKDFSNLVANIKGQACKPDNKWPTISRKTQLLVDSVKASIDKGFESVEVLY